jgi:hypothetical protein
MEKPDGSRQHWRPGRHTAKLHLAEPPTDAPIWVRESGGVMTKRSLMLVGAAAGGFAPVWFIALVIVQGLLYPDYSHIAQPISALAAYEQGWLQNTNFYVAGVLQVLLAVALHVAILPTRFGVAGIVLLVLSAMGLMFGGWFPWIMDNGIPRETPGHVVGAITFFAAASIALLSLSRRLRADPLWRDLSGIVSTAGALMLMLFVLLGAFAIDEGTPLHPWAGLLQRVVVLIWFGCLIALSTRLRRIAKTLSIGDFASA